MPHISAVYPLSVDRRKLFHFLFFEAILILAMTFAGSFSLVYIIRSGMGYAHTSLFMILAFLTASILCILSPKLISRPRLSMAVGTALLAGHYALMASLEGMQLVIFPPILYGAHIPLFWIPFNIATMRMTSMQDRGGTLGLIFLIFPAVSVVGPILGGALIELLGFSTVFIFALILLGLNGVAIAASRAVVERDHSPSVTPAFIPRWLSTSFFSEGIYEGMAFIAIPLLSYQFTASAFGVGGLLSIFALIGAISTLLLGRLSDKRGERLLFLRLGAIVVAPLLILAGLASTLWNYTVFLGLANLMIPLAPLFLFATAIDRAERRIGEVVLFREVLLNTGRTLGALAVLLITLSYSLGLALAVSGLFLLAIWPLSHRTRDNEERSKLQR